MLELKMWGHLGQADTPGNGKHDSEKPRSEAENRKRQENHGRNILFQIHNNIILANPVKPCKNCYNLPVFV